MTNTNQQLNDRYPQTGIQNVRFHELSEAFTLPLDQNVTGKIAQAIQIINEEMGSEQTFFIKLGHYNNSETATWFINILSTEHYLVNRNGKRPSEHKYIWQNAGYNGVSVNTVINRYNKGEDIVRRA